MNPFLVNISLKFAKLNFLPCKAKEGIFEVICTHDAQGHRVFHMWPFLPF